VSKLGRNTQGVTLIKVQEGERLVGVAPILDVDDDLDTNLLTDSEEIDASEIYIDNDVQKDANE
jgi:DNA gyrase subunit A